MPAKIPMKEYPDTPVDNIDKARSRWILARNCVVIAAEKSEWEWKSSMALPDLAMSSASACVRTLAFRASMFDHKMVQPSEISRQW